MNERIKKLMIEAFQSHYGDPVTQVTREKAIELVSGWGEKFAELIVQECMWKIMQRKEEAIDNDWHVDEAMSAALSDISEHFGVEQ